MIKSYLLRHLQVLFAALGQLARTPVASLLTVAVIGITLALPTGLYLVIENIQRLSGGWEDSGRVSLFLKRAASTQAASTLADRLRRLSAVTRVEYISPEMALAEFKRTSGFGGALNALERNPLPPVLVITPAESHRHPEALHALVTELSAYPEVDIAQLDLEWVRRLQAILNLAERGVWILALLLGLALLLIVGNTIRLAVLSRREEIAVIKLIGGTDAFIRRPFLYSGLLQGLLGAIMAWLLVSLSLLLLADPIRELSTLYASGFEIEPLGPEAVLALLATGGALGWIGSRLAVGRHLRSIEPA
jgi:cell division transport system permease protein